ncbi:hypothetical protein A3715_18860 [Oleiphilus sp. HI0009]|nr:hypothetical protein A3715_18860 [Oleiphilus sp. HI0009]
MFNKDKVKINQRSVPMPFYNSAVLVDFPTLDDKYVDFCDDILRESFDLDYRRNELLKCFESLDKSPFWFRLLLSELTTNHIPVADAIDKIHSRIRLDQGLESIQKKMNMLDRLVFRRIHQEQELYSMQALDEYREQTGKKTQKGSVQRSVSKLVNWGVVTEMDNSYFVEKAGLYQLLFDQN